MQIKEKKCLLYRPSKFHKQKAKLTTLLFLQKEIQKTFGVSLGQAKRLIRTETAAIYTEAALDSYSNTGIEYYEIIGDADCGNTGVCPIGEIFRVDEAGSHDTPPFHPNCKCCIAPVPNYVAQGY